jgi:hypothetical protein
MSQQESRRNACFRTSILFLFFYLPGKTLTRNISQTQNIKKVIAVVYLTILTWPKKTVIINTIYFILIFDFCLTD